MKSQFTKAYNLTVKAIRNGVQPPRDCNVFPTREKAREAMMDFASSRKNTLTVKGGDKGYCVLYQDNVSECSLDIRVIPGAKYEYFLIVGDVK